MYTFTSKKLKRKRKTLLKKYSKPMDVIEFGRSLAHLNSIFDGHTQISLGHLSFSITETDKVFFPKPVQLLDGKLYLIRQKSNLKKTVNHIT